MVSEKEKKNTLILTHINVIICQRPPGAVRKVSREVVKETNRNGNTIYLTAPLPTLPWARSDHGQF